MASPTLSSAFGGTKIEPHVLHVSICVEDAVTKVRFWPINVILAEAGVSAMHSALSGLIISSKAHAR